MSHDFTVSDGWDRTFFNFSSQLAEPFCQTFSYLRYRLPAPLDPKKFNNFPDRNAEIAFRALVGITASFAAVVCAVAPLPILCTATVLGLGSKLFRALAVSLQKEGFTHVRGEAPESTLSGEIKVMNWNVCGIGGGMDADHGGLKVWQSRINGLLAEIKKEDPDVLILQEIYDTALCEQLIDQLKGSYAHFFTHLGPNVWGSEGGIMVLSKCAVHHFSHTSFTNNDWTLNRGFATLELKSAPKDPLPSIRIIGTHLIHGNERVDHEKRMKQVAQIVNSVASKTLQLPTVLTGDLNIERDEEGSALAPYLRHGYLGNEETCTNRLTEQWNLKPPFKRDEIIDYISLFKRTLPDGRILPVAEKDIEIPNCHLIKAFDQTYNTQTALSDHHGLGATIKGI